MVGESGLSPLKISTDPLISKALINAGATL